MKFRTVGPYAGVMATTGVPIPHASLPSQSQSGVNYTIAYDDSGTSVPSEAPVIFSII